MNRGNQQAPKLRTVTIVAVVLSAALVPAGVAGAEGNAASSEPVPFIVGFHELPDQRDDYQGEPVVDISQDLGFLVVETDEPQRFRRDAKQDSSVRYIEEDHRNHSLSLTPDDPRYSDQYGPQVTKTESAWDTTFGSTAIVAGFLDSGISETHGDIESSRVSDGYDYYHGDGTPEDVGGACGYHGTHVAGIASATTDNGQGVAGMSQHVVTMHKVFDLNSDGECVGTFTSRLADAITDLADKGAHISSNSWGSSVSSSTLNDAIDHAHNKGVIHVAAAGNQGPCSDCVKYPWKDRPGKVIVASCTDSNDNFCDFSSQGPEVDVAAPGAGVLSLDGATTDGYKKLSGTSMSAPHVSGAVSLYLDAGGNADFSTIETDLGATADDLGLSSNRQGDGRLDTGELVRTVNIAPVAAFDVDCDGQDCTFDASNSSDSDGTITSYEWEFGDGSTGTGEVVDHTFPTADKYTVTLTVTDDGGASDQALREVSAVDGPDAIHVHRIDHDVVGLHVDATVQIGFTDDAWGVSDATVTIEICNTLTLCRTATGPTDENGEVTFRWQYGLGGQYRTCVTAIHQSGVPWDDSADHAEDGNCATDIVL